MSDEDRFSRFYGSPFVPPAIQAQAEEEFEEEDDDEEEEEEFSATDADESDFDDDGSLNPVEDNPRRNAKGQFVKSKKRKSAKKGKRKTKKRGRARGRRLSSGTTVRGALPARITYDPNSTTTIALASRRKRRSSSSSKRKKRVGSKKRKSTSRKSAPRTVEGRVSRLERAVSFLSHNDRVTQRIMKGISSASPESSAMRRLTSGYRAVPGYRSLIGRRG